MTQRLPTKNNVPARQQHTDRSKSQKRPRSQRKAILLVGSFLLSCAMVHLVFGGQAAWDPTSGSTDMKTTTTTMSKTSATTASDTFQTVANATEQVEKKKKKNGTTSTTTVVSATLVPSSSPSSSSSSSSSSLTKDDSVPTNQIQFVPFPFRLLGFGRTLACEWKTSQSMTDMDYRQFRIGPSQTTDNQQQQQQQTTDEPNKNKNEKGNNSHLDTVQQRALSEGLCVPIAQNQSSVPVQSSSIRLFSSDEARQCLADKTLLFAGHREISDVYVGLAEIVLSTTLLATEVDKRVMAADKLLQTQVRNKGVQDFPDIQWVCEAECNARAVPWMLLCSTCLAEAVESATLANQKNASNSDDMDGSGVVAIGRVGHAHWKALNLTEDVLVKQIFQVQIALEKSMLLLTFPMDPVPNSTKLEKTGPDQMYREFMRNGTRTPLANPVLDLSPMERYCSWENCTTSDLTVVDAPFVNRWKAQLLLNTLCADQDYDMNKHHPGIVLRKADLVGPAMIESTNHVQRPPSSPHFVTNSTLDPPAIRHVPEERIGGKVFFVPFPHRNIGVGIAAAACEWQYRDATNFRDPFVASLLGRDFRTVDTVQSQALSEMICIPRDLNQIFELHVYSAAQARKCLGNVTLGLAGDSYTRNLFIELGAVLFGTTTNVEIVGGKHRSDLLHMMNEDIEGYRDQWDAYFPDVRWICHEECYGKQAGFVELCSGCLKRFRSSLSGDGKDVVTFVGAGTHFWDDNITATMDTFRRFWNATPETIFATLVSYSPSKIPIQFRKKTNLKGKTLAYRQQIDQSGLYDNVKIFDYFQLTEACWMDNCTKDGGHRSRFVNRWKVQLLLNTLCKYT